MSVAEREVQYDPLTDPAWSPPIPPIDISTDGAKLRTLLSGLLKNEQVLDEQGVTCPIKGTEATCLACPVSAARDYSNPKGQLCRVGQEQERVTTVMLAQANGL